jgi:hypothetical protein
MPRRNLLTPAERTSLLAFPVTDDELIRHYTFAEPDLSVIRQRRGSHNRLGFAVQLCCLRYPGFADGCRAALIPAEHRRSSVAHRAGHLAAVRATAGNAARAPVGVASVAEADAGQSRAFARRAKTSTSGCYHIFRRWAGSTST